MEDVMMYWYCVRLQRMHAMSIVSRDDYAEKWIKNPSDSVFYYRNIRFY